VAAADADATHLQRWFAEGAHIRNDAGVAEEVLAFIGPMTRGEAAADVRRGRAFLRQGIRELGELAEPTVGLDCATLLR
jgi:hypothetical protein